MRAMKASGIEWIGEIPEGWSIERLKYHALFNPPTRLPAFIDDDQVSFIPMDHLKSGFHLQGKTDYGNVKSGYVVFADNDILMAKVTPCLENGNLAIATNLIEGVGFGSTEINVLRCLSIKNKYLFYFLQCYSYIEKATYNMFGVAGLKRLDPKFIPNSVLPTPNEEEQTRIIKYLDSKCAEIDALIAAKEKTNELLKEQRKSIIYEAVTKGLDPTVRMKDSGIEWIGEIPEDWETCKIKYYSILKGRIGWQGLKSDEFIEEGPFLITGVDFDNGIINWDNCVHITEARFDEAPEIHVNENDILITKDGTVGKVAIPINCPEKVSLNSGVLLIRKNGKKEYNNRFLYYVLISDVFWKWFNISKNGNSTIIHLYQEQFSNFEYPCPVIFQQIRLAEYLDMKCTEIDALLISNEDTIRKLKEYRQSLIYEVVTGKYEV